MTEITDQEAEIRAWVELNTIGRDNPNAPARYDIAYLQTVLRLLDEARAEIARLTDVCEGWARQDPQERGR